MITRSFRTVMLLLALSAGAGIAVAQNSTCPRGNCPAGSQCPAACPRTGGGPRACPRGNVGPNAQTGNRPATGRRAGKRRCQGRG